MNRLLILLFVLIPHLNTAGEVIQELVNAEPDQLCYVVGEHLKLEVQINLPDGSASPSRVAYVEIADTAQLYCQAMLPLDGGSGYVEIPLPTTMHSGAYQVCVYTRGLRNFGEQAFYTTQIGIINPTKLSAKDNIKFLPADNDAITTTLAPNTNTGRRATTPPTEFPFAYELEGHIVTAKVTAQNDDVENVRLALVGKSMMIYDGRRARDGYYDFYTTDIYGEQPCFVSAYSSEGKSLPTTLVSPYAQVLPTTLPQLIVRCSEDALKTRYTEAMRQSAIDDWHKKGTMPRTITFMGSTPQYIYDLDEWTSMNTVSEMLTEFIRGVYVKRNNGIPYLYTDSQTPALVLFDGIPIYNVKQMLDYDAHHLRYVQIYDERYTFGQSYCYGVVSFISRSGKLPNYTLDQGTTFASYQFPQANPDKIN